MPQPTPLYHVNGGDPLVITCGFCGASLHDERERCATTTAAGPKFFCKADPEHPQDSCYLSWRRRHN